MPSWPTISVEIGFDSDAIDAFVQSDLSTPATWTDVTAYVLKLSYSRGRQRQLGRVEAGTGTILLDNADGRFDPENSASPYYLSGRGMMPGRHVRVQAAYAGVTYSLLYMFVNNWAPAEVSRSTSPTVRVDVSDYIAWITRTSMQDIDEPAVIGALNGEAIYYILRDELLLPLAQIDTDPGTITVPGIGAANNYDGNIWAAAQSYADTEEGSVLYVNGAGVFVYRDHTHRYARERSIIPQASFDNGAAAPAGSLPFSAVTYARDAIDLYSSASVSPAGVGAAYYTNPVLVGRYFQRDISKSTRHPTESSALRLAQRLVARSAALWSDHALAQHTSLTIEPTIGNSDLWTAALRLEISDLIQVTERLYPGTRTRTIPSFVEGMSVDIDMDETLSWRVIYRLSRALTAFHWMIGGKGVAFPTNPTAGDLYFRTDLGLLCYYDGTRWVTAHEYTAPFGDWNAGGPYSTTGASPLTPWHTDYNPYITRSYVTFFVDGTNNGSNYWTMTLTTSAGAALSTYTTSALSGSTLYTQNLNTNTAVTSPAPTYFYYNLTKTGTPGNLRFVGSFRYRMIVT